MRLQSIFMILLVIALLFTGISYIIGDFNTNYPEAGNVTLVWETKYSYVNDISVSFASLQSELNQLQYETGWSRILGGLLVFGKGVITALITVLSVPGLIIGVVTQAALDVSIPAPIVTILGLMITGSVIFMVVKFLHRSPI